MARQRFVEPKGGPVATITLELREIKVYLSESGRFYAQGPEGTRLESKSLEGLRGALKDAIRRNTPLNFPITVLEDDAEFDITDYEFHEERGPAATAEPQPLTFRDVDCLGTSRNNYVDTVDQDGRKDRIWTGRRGGALRRLTHEEQERLRVLWRVAWLAKRDYEVYLDSLKIDDLEAELKKIVAAHVAAGVE